jgi:phage tail-like protein
MSESSYYPPPKFYFSVSVLGSGSALAALTAIDSSFQEVSGIEVEFGVEEVAEGGQNRFVHRLPKQAKYPPLVLRRGIVTKDSVLGEWVGLTLGSTLSLPIIPQNLLVMLLGPNGDPLVAWGFSNAWPLKWKTASLNSTENEVLTESLEFSYSYFIRTTLGSSLSAGVGLAQLAASLA